MTITVESGERLEQRRGERRCKGDQTNLAKVQAKGISEQRIKSGKEGLHGVVEEMTETDSEQDFERAALSTTVEWLGVKRRDVGLGCHICAGRKRPPLVRHPG